MTQCELAAALLVWNMTLNHIITSPSESEDALEIAYRYGTNISKREHLDEVSCMFDWDAFFAMVEELK